MKLLYKPVILLLVGLAAVDTQAQQESNKSFTLQQCIDYALENSVNVRNAHLDEEIAASRVKETIGIGLPQINGNVSLTNNNQLRRFFALKSTAYGFAKANLPPTVTQSDFLSPLKDNDVVSQQSFFQLKNSGDAGINVSQLLFNGSYIVGLKASRVFKEVASRSTNQTKEQIILQVTKAYFAVLINKERTKLFTSNIARVDSLLKNTIALNKNGFSESIDVDRIQVTLNNIETERDKFSNLEQLGLELLKFQMYYPLDQPMEVTGSIEEMQVLTDISGYAEGFDYKIRPDYKVLEANRKLQDLNVKNQFAAGMPVLTGTANLGYFIQARDFSGLYSSNPNVPSNTYGVGGDKWYNYSTYAISLNVPIFSGLQRHQRFQQEKLRLAKIDNSFRTLKQGIDLEIKQASVSYNNSIKTLTSQKLNMELAAKVAKVTKIKYEQGIGSNLEVVDAENSLQQSQTNYYNALFDTMVAKTDLEKAYGKLLPTNNK